jgi:HK97 gp10 family phage protein
MQLTFRGGLEMARALRQLPRAIAEEVLETAVVAGASIIRAAAAQKAPRPAERRRPGTVRLADSIKVTVTEKSHAFVTVNVGTRVPYAHLVEYGHQIIPRGKTRERVSITTVRISKRTGKQIVSTRFGLDPTAQMRLNDRRKAGARGMVAARPFLRPAFDENREAVLRRIGQVIEKGIEVHARRLAETTAPGRAA